jgi:hypothetical protein
LKALAFADAEGTARLRYNDPAWLAARHGVAPGEATKAMSAALAAATNHATAA